MKFIFNLVILFFRLQNNFFFRLDNFIFNKKTFFRSIFDQKEKDFRRRFFKNFFIIGEHFFFLFGLGLNFIILLQLIFVNDFQNFNRILCFLAVIKDIKYITKMIPNIIRMLDLEPNICCCIILDKSINSQQLLIWIVIANKFLWTLQLCKKFVYIDFVLNKCVGWNLLSCFFTRIYMNWRWNVWLYYTSLVFLVWCVYDQYYTKLIFLWFIKYLTFLLKEVSENLILEKVTSPFLLNSLKVSPSSLTSSR